MVLSGIVRTSSAVTLARMQHISFGGLHEGVFPHESRQPSVPAVSVRACVEWCGSFLLAVADACSPARFRVEFTSELGTVEVGIDAGGPYREFLELLGKHTFDPQYDWWRLTSQGELYPNPTPMFDDDLERYFEFSGMVMGKLLMEGALVSVASFACACSDCEAYGFRLRADGSTLF